MGIATNLQELPTGNRAAIRPRKVDRKGLLKALRDAAVVGGIYAFFGGWAYLTYYIRFFGIPTVAVDASVYTTVVMATNLMLQPYAIFAKLLTLLVIAAAVLAARRAPYYRTAIVWGMALAFFPLLQFVAYQSAIGIASARLRTGNFDRVSFEFRPESGPVAAPFNGEAALCLIHQSTQRYYVARCPADPAEPRRVFEIPASDVKMMTISSFQANLSR